MLRARNLERGTYMLRLRHRAADGRYQVVRLRARRL
jgi:hypothetical protein